MRENLPAPSVGDWMQKLRAAMFDAVKEAEIKEICEGLVKRAKEGDAQATRMLFEYVLGGSRGPQVVTQNNYTIRAPKKRTKALPGETQKLTVLQKRAAAGVELFHDRDAKRNVS